MEKIKRILPVRLTDEEKLEMAVELSQELQKLEDLEDEKKSAAQQMKYEIDAHESIVSRMAKCVRTGEEDREVECEIVYNTPVRGMKSVIRLDTMETIEDMDMTDADKQRAADLLQTRLPLNEANHA